MNTQQLDMCFSAGEQLRKQNPLIHCITSPIAVNDCANAVLAIGARPIMAEHPKEAAGITAISQALGVSLANITDARAESIMISGRQALEKGLHSVIDVVGVNCSEFRMELANQFIRDCRPAVIKGNASEIRAIAGAAYGEAGIDTAASDQVTRDNPGSVEAAAEVVRSFSKETGAVVLASGIIDLVSDGTQVWMIENGSPLMARVTGTGCILNCLIASCLALSSARGHLTVSQAVCYAAVLLGIAGEIAEQWVPRKGALGSYHIAMIDALSLTGTEEIREKAKISLL